MSEENVKMFVPDVEYSYGDSSPRGIDEVITKEIDRSVDYYARGAEEVSQKLDKLIYLVKTVSKYMPEETQIAFAKELGWKEVE